MALFSSQPASQELQVSTLIGPRGDQGDHNHDVEQDLHPKTVFEGD